jgi:hypothetical protein
MTEKRGNLIKLKYDFNESLCCEVFNNGGWARVTEREFRSWNGERRVQGNPYFGPIYYYSTNEIAENPTKPGLIFKTEADPRQKFQPRSYHSYQL